MNNKQHPILERKFPDRQRDRVSRWLRSPITVGLSLLIGFSALIFGFWNQQDQNDKLRSGLCGLVQPIAAQPNPPISALGETLVAEARASGETFGCTDDPFDRR